MGTNQPKVIDYIVKDNVRLFREIYSFYFSQNNIDNICCAHINSAFYIGPSECVTTRAKLYSVQDAVDKIKWS